MANEDWPAVRDIYAEGIATGNATFETDVPDWTKWDSGHHKECRLLAKNGEEILGWAALSPVSTRQVYRGVAEVSIYVARSARACGVGKALLMALIEASERCGIWTLQAGIFAENTVSVRLHQRAGFRTVGTRERIACLNGTWRDTVLMERRSTITGV